MGPSRGKRSFSLLCWLLLAAPAVVFAGVLTPLGTQPPLTFPLLPPGDCESCHAGYDSTNHIEPWDTWAGSMMANASRDPVFWAALDVANNDGLSLDPPVAGIGEYCLRCHSSAGWLAGRANSDEGPGPFGEADGCALEGQIDEPGADFTGLSCHLCHRMLVNDSPPAGQDSVYYENGNFWLDDEICANTGMGGPPDEPCRRGPYANYQGMLRPPHEWAYSDYHVDNDLCGNCHNVTNPLLEFVDGTGTGLGVNFPIERTFKEWQQSDFSDDQSTEFANCSACHMPDADSEDPLYASNQGLFDRGGDLPIHQFAGGNSWIPQVLKNEYGSTLDRNASLDATTVWAEDMLQNRSGVVEISSATTVGEGGVLPVEIKITNLSGHKLPTGYGEGRRMWLQLEARDGLGQVFWQSGVWDPATGALTHDAQVKIYEVQQGIWDHNGTGTCDVVDLGGNHLFHFVRNNCVALDNRIPPLGFRPESSPGVPDPETLPVNYNYPETSPGSGVLVHWDRTRYLIPVPVTTPSPITVESTLVYQTSSKEYIEFLRDQAVDNGFADDCLARNDPLPPGMSRGEYLYGLWESYGRSAPVEMGTASAEIEVVDLFADGFESGDTTAWSASLE